VRATRAKRGSRQSQSQSDDAKAEHHHQRDARTKVGKADDRPHPRRSPCPWVLGAGQCQDNDKVDVRWKIVVSHKTHGWTNCEGLRRKPLSGRLCSS
jgi:hypothetical protein